MSYRERSVSSSSVRASTSISSWSRFRKSGIRSGVHAFGARGGQWNAAWAKFFAEHPNASADEIWEFLKQLIDEIGFCAK
jgi:hypothetical protein